MILVTGAAGFIGSVLVGKLNKEGNDHLIISDDFSHKSKENNYLNKKYSHLVDRNNLFEFLEGKEQDIDFVFHIGARTDTTEMDKSIFDQLNLNYSKQIWDYCTKNKISLVYASSAATYGDGELGYNDDHSIVSSLKPLNPYGESKNEFDKWVLTQDNTPPNWYGLKFFNVYGPNEYHKGRMASVIFHAYRQIEESGKVKLFKSHRPDYNDGEQIRDFIYVKDLVKVCSFLMDKKPESGIYNLGTGKARTFNDLVRSTFAAMGIESNIEYIDTPEDIRDKYQYFTEANMEKLLNAGYDAGFQSLEDGIKDYIQNYRSNEHYY